MVILKDVQKVLNQWFEIQKLYKVKCKKLYNEKGTYNRRNKQIRDALVKSSAEWLCKEDKYVLAIDLVFTIKFNKWMRQGVNVVQYATRAQLKTSA